MRYLIDGYNLLHATGHLAGKVNPLRLEHARHALLDRLAAFAKASGGDITVVFDARNAPSDVRPEQHYQGVRICNALTEEADDLIEELIRHEPTPRQLIVVSNDRRLKEAARRGHCGIQSCLDFYEATAPARPSAPDSNDDTSRKRAAVLTEQEVRAWLREFGADGET